MNTKRKLNCYFFSNLIICFLSLNMLVNNKPTTLTKVNNGNKATLVNIFEKDKLTNDLNDENINYQQPDNMVMEISVSTKSMASRNVIPYVKPSYNSITGNNLVNYAENYLGLAYVYAGDSLSTGTDCSGFTRLIFQEFGIHLGRTVESQLYSGTYVSREDLQAGDLVFYGYSSSSASHVAIYMGNGLIIHQSNPRHGVKIDSVNIMSYVTARRLITAEVLPKEEEDKEIKKQETSEKEKVEKEEKDKKTELTKKDNSKDKETSSKKELTDNTSRKEEDNKKVSSNSSKNNSNNSSNSSNSNSNNNISKDNLSKEEDSKDLEEKTVSKDTNSSLDTNNKVDSSKQESKVDDKVVTSKEEKEEIKEPLVSKEENLEKVKEEEKVEDNLEVKEYTTIVEEKEPEMLEEKKEIKEEVQEPIKEEKQEVKIVDNELNSKN